jgi:hypothetical protein
MRAIFCIGMAFAVLLGSDGRHAGSDEELSRFKPCKLTVAKPFRLPKDWEKQPRQEKNHYEK